MTRTSGLRLTESAFDVTKIRLHSGQGATRSDLTEPPNKCQMADGMSRTLDDENSGSGSAFHISPMGGRMPCLILQVMGKSQHFGMLVHTELSSPSEGLSGLRVDFLSPILSLCTVYVCNRCACILVLNTRGR